MVLCAFMLCNHPNHLPRGHAFISPDLNVDRHPIPLSPSHHSTGVFESSLSWAAHRRRTGAFAPHVACLPSPFTLWRMSGAHFSELNNIHFGRVPYLWGHSLTRLTILNERTLWLRTWKPILKTLSVLAYTDIKRYLWKSSGPLLNRQLFPLSFQ